MPIIASVKGNADFEPIPAGNHHAICYGVCDLGTQPSDIYAPSRKVLIQWEIPGERITLERDGKPVDLPRAISHKFTLTMNPKGNLRGFLESWRGRPFTDEEAGKFDIATLVGANCLLNIFHKAGTGKNSGKTYANVKTASPLIKGMNKLPLKNPKLVFSLGDFGDKPITFPANMPEWIQNVIVQSEEYQARLDASFSSDASALGEDAAFPGAEGASFENAQPAPQATKPPLKQPVATRYPESLSVMTNKPPPQPFQPPVSRPKAGPDGQAFAPTPTIPEDDVPFRGFTP